MESKFRWNRLGRSCWAAEEDTRAKGVAGKVAAGGKGFFRNVLAVDQIRDNGRYIAELWRQAGGRRGKKTPPHPQGGKVAFQEACEEQGADEEKLQKLEESYLLRHRTFYLLTLASLWFCGLGSYLLASRAFDFVNLNLALAGFGLGWLFSGKNLEASLRLWQIRNRQLCGFGEFFVKNAGWRRLLLPV